MLSAEDQRQRPSSTLIIQCKRTTKKVEKFLYWKRDESGKFTQTDQPKNLLNVSFQSAKPIDKCESLYKQRITDDHMIEIANKVMSPAKWEVELCDCDITAKHLKLLHDTFSLDCKISKFSVSYTSNIKELIEDICAIIHKAKISKLSLECDNLNDVVIDLLQKCLHSKPVDCLEALDISYNELIGPTGFRKIGEIMRIFGIGTLKATDCNITDEKLENLLKGIQDKQLTVLDISCNTQITERGFNRLARTVSKKGVGTLLNLSDCDLTKETINEFHDCLPKTNDEKLLEHLDVSYNTSMAPITSLGSILLKCGISKLNLAGCKLSEDHLANLRESTSKHQMDSISMRDNRTISSCLTEIAELVKQSKLNDLDISNCMFSAAELGRFRKKLENVKLQQLHLGDAKREHDIPYIKELCNLLLNVTDTFHLQFKNVSNATRRLLIDHFEKSNTTRIIMKLPEEIIEEYTKQPVAD